MATAKGLDEAGLKVLQLECIISSKDKEISLLREQLSQDQEVRVLLPACCSGIGLLQFRRFTGAYMLVRHNKQQHIAGTAQTSEPHTLIEDSLAFGLALLPQFFPHSSALMSLLRLC